MHDRWRWLALAMTCYIARSSAVESCEICCYFCPASHLAGSLCARAHAHALSRLFCNRLRSVKKGWRWIARHYAPRACPCCSGVPCVCWWVGEWGLAGWNSHRSWQREVIDSRVSILCACRGPMHTVSKAVSTFLCSIFFFFDFIFFLSPLVRFV